MPEDFEDRLREPIHATVPSSARHITSASMMPIRCARTLRHGQLIADDRYEYKIVDAEHDLHHDDG